MKRMTDWNGETATPKWIAENAGAFEEGVRETHSALVILEETAQFAVVGEGDDRWRVGRNAHSVGCSAIAIGIVRLDRAVVVNQVC